MKLCLNMIVKNESAIITRLLKSVLPFIDCYCICDTGSTDNTIDLIQTFFEENNIFGKIIKEPFQDFGYNRTFALKACQDLDVEYILLLDADMIFESHISRLELHQLLTKDIYYLFQGDHSFYYKNVRIVKNNKDIEYWGVTHEYVKHPDYCTREQIDKNKVFINDIGDGGCKDDKFIRDIALLTKGLEKHPNNDRYTFYLANSYKDSRQYENAIEMYKKRIKLGGWEEEVFYSYYNIGNCYKALNDMQNAIYWWLDGYDYYPERIESIYEVIHHYRCESKYNIAYGYYLLANYSNKNYNHSDHLFLKKDIYDYKLDYEFSIIGYYCNRDNFDMNKMCLHVLNSNLVEHSIVMNVLSNYKFYKKNLSSLNQLSNVEKKLLDKVGGINNYNNSFNQPNNDNFNKSTPSICMHNEKLYICTRNVNYFINEKGGYENKEHITTINVMSVLNPLTFEQLQEDIIMPYNVSHDGKYVGLEDVRLFSDSLNQLRWNANRGINIEGSSNTNMWVETGIYGTDASSLIEFKDKKNIEKNWVLFEKSGNFEYCIYKWFPLTIGKINMSTEPATYSVTHSFQMPNMFKLVRGSTNGVNMPNNEVWFICHIVSYESKRFYYHLFVCIDKQSMQLKYYTPFFTFENSPVEYTLGFIHEPHLNTLLIGYSKMDRETNYIRISTETVRNMWVNNV